MATLLEKANNILLEKTNKIKPENLVSRNKLFRCNSEQLNL